MRIRSVLSIVLCLGLTPAGITPASLTPAAAAPARGEVREVLPITTFVDGTAFDLSETSWLSYSTTDTFGKPTAATASLFRATRAWNGPGERPVVVITPFTQGGGDNCAFSHTLTTGAQFNPANPGQSSIASLYYSVHAMLEQGWDVIVPDHPGLGTPEPHSYMDNIASGRALIDAASAGVAHLDRRGAPIALAGHSQGAGATAWAAENAASYAPELNIVAAGVSAPPHHLPNLARDVDGTKESGMLILAINTLMRQDPAIRAEFERVLTPEGKALVEQVDSMCVPAMFATVGTRHSRDLTRTGESLGDLIQRIPEIQAEIRRQELGTTAPSFPVLLTYHQSDHLVSWEDSHELGVRWQKHGGDVRFHAYPRDPLSDALKTTHSVTSFTPIPATVEFFSERFAGQS